MKIDPNVLRRSRAVRLWAAGVTLGLMAIAVMVTVAFVVIAYWGLDLGRGVYATLILIAVVLAVGVGVVMRWLAKGL